MKIKIKGQYVLAGISYRENEPLAFPTEFGLLTLFQIPPGHPIKKDKYELMCDVSETVDVPEHIQNLMSRPIPEGVAPPPVQFTAPSTNFRAANVFISFPPTGPKELLDYMAGLDRRLVGLVERIVGILRWRFNTDGENRAVKSSLGTHFSINGTDWHKIPTQIDVSMEFRRDLTRTIIEKNLESLGELVKVRAEEPVYHAMLREAWDIRWSNQRSCLLLAVAALETAVKQCGSALANGTEWLLLNLPAPPVVRMLQKWVPNLPARCKINGRVLPPPKRIAKLLQEAVEARNGLAHRGEIEMEPRLLRDMLDSIQDTLWILDYYRGHQWALEYIRTETCKELHEMAGAPSKELVAPPGTPETQ